MSVLNPGGCVLATHFGRATHRDDNGGFQRSTAARGLAEYRTREYGRRETKVLASQPCCIRKRSGLLAATIGAIANIGVSMVSEPFPLHAAFNGSVNRRVTSCVLAAETEQFLFDFEPLPSIGTVVDLHDADYTLQEILHLATVSESGETHGELRLAVVFTYSRRRPITNVSVSVTRQRRKAGTKLASQ
ncbi:hypothetical protein ACLKMY_24170 [Paraburkholderia mimosarum]|uniref:hypothetical protein n=1 Tax=Paraburkholderia mimosarum TaxID=312026 RepID=UPI0039C0F899